MVIPFHRHYGPGSFSDVYEALIRILQPVVTVLAFVFWGVSFSIFILALKNFDLSYAFALFDGAGVILVAAVGVPFLGKPVSPRKAVSVVLIAPGVAGLNLWECFYS